MNHDQMIAWLSLEGWTPYITPTGAIPAAYNANPRAYVLYLRGSGGAAYVPAPKDKAFNPRPTEWHKHPKVFIKQLYALVSG